MYNPIQVTATVPSVNNPISLSLLRHGFLLIALAFACFAISPQVRADCQQGCDTVNNANTFLGEDALLNHDTVGNTADGSGALEHNTLGTANTATCASALGSNTKGRQNTATGYVALSSNTTGIANVANGKWALSRNKSGFGNTATGWNSLATNTTGSGNIAIGYSAGSAITGDKNIAIATVALQVNPQPSASAMCRLRLMLLESAESPSLMV